MLSQEEVLDFCNKVRKAGDADVLDSLLPGIPVEGNACLIANNLNFDCEISPMGDHSNYSCWYMRIRGENAGDIACRISKETGMELINAWYKSAKLKLPVELAEVAAKFDEVWEAYEDWQGDHWDEELDKDEYVKQLEHPWLLELSSKFLREHA